MPNPPEAADLILRALLPADARESVSGNLLEEYRECRVPAAGEFRADVWYWRQVGGLWLRAYWWLVVPAIVLLAVHDVFNALRAPSGASYLDGLPRLVAAAFSPFGTASLLALATAYGSWRTERWQGGFVAALGVAVVVWCFMLAWWTATFYPFAHAQESNPYWVAAWHWSTHRGAAGAGAGLTGTPEESFVDWLYWDNVGALIIGGIALLVTSFVWGGIGALCGGIVSHRRRAGREDV